jgi:hypothetical protein
LWAIDHEVEVSTVREFPGSAVLQRRSVSLCKGRPIDFHPNFYPNSTTFLWHKEADTHSQKTLNPKEFNAAIRLSEQSIRCHGHR